MEHPPTYDLFVAAAWSSRIDRRYTIMRYLPADHELDSLAQQRGNRWEPTKIGQEVEALLRETVRLTAGMLGSLSHIFFAEDSVQITPYFARDKASSAQVEAMDRQVLEALSKAYRLPIRLFGYNHSYRFVLLSDALITATAPSASH